MPDLSDLTDLSGDATVTENVYQLAFIDIGFQLLDVALNLILAIATIFMSGFWNAIFSW